jgi:peptidoglycan hydrolase-like amidase
MSLVPRNSWEVVEECPSLSTQDDQGRKRRVSTCGKFRIVSGARGSRSERMVSGVLESISNDQMMVLETDPETYADSVLAAEAADLKSEARKALRAVIVWNATRGDVRHPDTGALCDSTHCMVFQGEIPGHRQERGPTTDITLLSWLDQVAHRHVIEWLPFSKGGSDEWRRSISAPDLQKLVAEASVLDVRRERTRTGDVIIHLVYPENEELVPCELFRNRLKLYSCPETIRYDQEVNAWLFAGVGEGHGEGLSIEKARVQSRSGSNAWQILGDAYREEIWRR